MTYMLMEVVKLITQKTETQKTATHTKTGAIKALFHLLRYQTCFLLLLQY